ncbi:ABC transporter permease [Frigoribacterium sp. 2-23]|uniref:ABC transporter permease n=1 Tax=Frigoribacterium sp. 2-23 TaxID=3415006 RepID=UPI003C70200C
MSSATATASIATAELRMMLRNRTVALSALLVPLAFGAFLLFTNGASAGGVLAGIQIIGMVGMGVYVSATTTLAARRQTLFLKRLRGGAVSDPSILTGLLAPVVVVSLAQLAIVLGVLAAQEPPVHAWLLIVAVLLAEAMFVGLALATAGFSTSPEHAQYTTLPLFFLTLGTAIWFQLTGVDDLIAVKRLLPGGGLMELIVLAWNGGDLGLLPWLLLPSVGWAVLGVLAAVRFFRWEPRR